jgi:putative PIN family toxin of toxin-antitoxin system
MTQGPAVIDTNVVVSGLITGLAASPTARILDGMIAGRFPFLLSIDLITEYREVLTRPKIRERHKLSDSQIDVILTEIAANGVMAEVESEPRARRKSDHHLRQILTAAPTAVLVTGDDGLSARLGKSTRTLTPREFADGLPSPHPSPAGRGSS